MMLNKKLGVGYTLTLSTPVRFRPTVAGIHGGPEGAYSLALSGGYEDDIDLGECMTFTGEGKFDWLRCP